MGMNSEAHAKQTVSALDFANSDMRLYVFSLIETPRFFMAPIQEPLLSNLINARENHEPQCIRTDVQLP